MFEKLEFYLNLKNDFALTFIQDKHRVYFFFEKIPKTLTSVWRGNTESPQVDEREYKPSSVFFLFLLFGFVKCTKKNHFGLFFCFLFYSFRLFLGGKTINLVNAKLVNTVINLCTLKCVLCLYSCKYSEKYKRYLKMIIKIYWSRWTINVAIELDVGYKNVMLCFFFVCFWRYFSLTSCLWVCGVWLVLRPAGGAACLIVHVGFCLFHLPQLLTNLPKLRLLLVSLFLLFRWKFPDFLFLF